jgi:hypothetical protein
MRRPLRPSTGLLSLGSLGSLLAAALGCSHTAEEVRGDPPPPPSPWMQVGLQMTGPEAEKEKFERCAKIAYEMGIAISAQAPVRAVMTLSDGGNRLTVVREGQTLRDESRPRWGMSSLCADAFAAAADASGFAVHVSRAEPGPECMLKGAVEGSVGGEWFALPSYDAALGIMRLQAARGGMNYVVMDAMRQIGGMLMINGRGYLCTGAPPVQGPAPMAPMAPAPAVPQGPACVPDCSPGYTCVGGKCVSACNPPCSGSQKCGADRTCR